MKHSDSSLHLLFVLSYDRQWVPLEGHAAPKPTYVEARCLPGNLVAGGDTREEAEQRLLKALELAMARAGSSDNWWAQAMETMRAEDTVIFERLGGRALLQRRFHSKPLNSKLNGDNVECAVFEESELEVVAACP